MIKFFAPLERLKNLNKIGKGIAALPTVLIITAIIVEIGVIIALSSYYLNISLYLSRTNSVALFAAETGINDAVIRIARNKNLSTSYTLTINAAASADVVVEPQSDTTTITATGKTGTVVKKIRAVVNIDSSDFKTTLKSWEEI